MTSTVRYKFVKNPSDTSAMLAPDFLNGTDGDDKPEKVVKHVLSDGDIGTATGQIGHVSGLILDVIPFNYNILWFEIGVYRPALVGGSINQYNDIQNQVGTINVNLTFTSTEVEFWVATDNTIRVYDKSHGNVDGTEIASGDVIIAKIYIGTKQSILDVMNP